MGSYKTVTKKRSVLAAIEEFYVAVEDLAEECQDGLDSAAEDTQNSSRGEALQETISTLEGIGSFPELPARADAQILGDLVEVEFGVQVYGGKYAGQEARHVRAANACAGALAAIDRIEEHLGGDEEGVEEDSLAAELQQWVDEVRDSVWKVESIDVWTMRG